MDCIFCKIIQGAIPAPRIYEDDKFICIRDIQPQAKKHLLVIPKTHVASITDAFPDGDSATHVQMMGELFAAASKVARQEGLAQRGFRAIINNGPDAAQTVFHIHLHLLGGEQLGGGLV